MPKGIVWAATSIKKESTLADQDFNKWYDEVHLPDVLSTGEAGFAARFKNLDPSRPAQYLAVYDVDSVETLDESKIQGLPTQHSLLGNKDVVTELHIDARVYKLVQVLEGPAGGNAKLGGMVTTCVDIAEEADQEFNDWFNNQHMDMVSMVRGFIRGTRWKLVDGSSFNASNPNAHCPRYATLYEYTSTDFPADQLAIVTGTQWSKKIIPQLTTVERDTWVPIGELESNPGKASRNKVGAV